MKTKTFAIITKEVQKEFEDTCNGVIPEDVPMICGIFGRACWQMGKEEGANRMNCTHCPLAEYAKEKQNQ